MKAFRNVTHAEFVDLPALVSYVVPVGFKRAEEVTAENVGVLCDDVVLRKALDRIEQRELEYARLNRVVRCKKDLEEGDERILFVRVKNGCDVDVGVLEVSVFAGVKEVIVGDECCESVNEVKLVGLRELERVVVGKGSFTREKKGCGNDLSRHFYLKDCPKVRELKIGSGSFSDYSVCEIENVNALEAIEMGDVNDAQPSNCFYHASLELKSDLIHIK